MWRRQLIKHKIDSAKRSTLKSQIEVHPQKFSYASSVEIKDLIWTGEQVPGVRNISKNTLNRFILLLKKSFSQVFKACRGKWLFINLKDHCSQSQDSKAADINAPELSRDYKSPKMTVDMLPKHFESLSLSSLCISLPVQLYIIYV